MLVLGEEIAELDALIEARFNGHPPRDGDTGACPAWAPFLGAEFIGNMRRPRR
ncbi:hypothetical protein [Streptomyces coeruleorubidus]|uniref:hypothetical protein n=1 Tax=Streptomyces coeruleorubidus TaxID=116188 RepID=UPI0033BCACE9